MKQFIALVHKDADSAYGVEFPDAPGCFSAADTLSDLQANAVEALSLYFEGEDIPEPRDLEAIRAEVVEEMATGAFLMAVPLVTSQSRIVRANISMDKGTLDAIDQAAKLRGLNRSSFLAEAALNEIEGRH
jgi:predicted RNase H-like HicB family nuclease